ncbi:MAG: diglucosylglycerate octanoyltransferase, partial [Mycobacteriales bacterium]
MPAGLLVIADSLTFHGPQHAELLTHPGLWPNVAAAQLGVPVDVVARQGWTARDAWWALTKDPYVYSVLLPRARAVVLAVGNMDHLPASIPTYLREGIAYLRPDWLRYAARRSYLAAHPFVVRLLQGRMRVLPQHLTDSYLTNSVQGLRLLRPDLTIVGVVPPGFDSPYYGHVNRTHDP